jgi:hypothetical protein
VISLIDPIPKKVIARIQGPFDERFNGWEHDLTEIVAAASSIPKVLDTR